MPVLQIHQSKQMQQTARPFGLYTTKSTEDREKKETTQSTNSILELDLQCTIRPLNRRFMLHIGIALDAFETRADDS